MEEERGGEDGRSGVAGRYSRVPSPSTEVSIPVSEMRKQHGYDNLLFLDEEANAHTRGFEVQVIVG